MQMISMRLYPVYMSLIYFCLLHTHLRLSPPSVMITRHQPPPLHSLFFPSEFHFSSYWRWCLAQSTIGPGLIYMEG